MFKKTKPVLGYDGRRKTAGDRCQAPPLQFAECLPALSISKINERADEDGLSVHDYAALLGLDLFTTTPHFGGIRFWFKCPVCGRRVGVLYFRDRYACRRCNRVVYASQYESKIVRFGGNIFKLLLKLDSIGWIRPKSRNNRKYIHDSLVVLTKLAKLSDISS